MCRVLLVDVEVMGLCMWEDSCAQVEESCMSYFCMRFMGDDVDFSHQVQCLGIDKTRFVKGRSPHLKTGLACGRMLSIDGFVICICGPSYMASRFVYLIRTNERPTAHISPREALRMLCAQSKVL